MKIIFLISNKPFTGKNFIAVGLGLCLIERKYKIGYIKLLGKLPFKKDNNILDEESYYVSQMLKMSIPFEDICCFVYSYDVQQKILESKNLDLQDRFLQIVDKQKDKDIIFVVSGDSFFEGYSFGISPLQLVKKIDDSKVLVVQTYNCETFIDDILAAKELFKDKFLGAVINKVDESRYEQVKNFELYLEKQNIPIFAVIKKDKLLESISIEKLAEAINGKVVCCEDKIEDFVENFLVGAMDPSCAFSYFVKTPNKAVITGTHRTDIQVIAMETSTKCIILTGGGYPEETIIAKAKEKSVPIIVTHFDTFSAVEKIEKLVGKTILKEKYKTERAKQIIYENFKIENFLKLVNV